ncbi:hypothetical protein AVEN_100717-1 [Araneus ventricosus]|uniref:Uncharacterized protein n=1 Tax=Araneus ventricosus TaxID=182803 RepID=A0A4Y2CV06_ARAVE|nr:hypothetical protein AVEN_100717-1 [Araneus ventricosus]
MPPFLIGGILDVCIERHVDLMDEQQIDGDILLESKTSFRNDLIDLLECGVNITIEQHYLSLDKLQRILQTKSLQVYIVKVHTF